MKFFEKVENVVEVVVDVVNCLARVDNEVEDDCNDVNVENDVNDFGLSFVVKAPKKSSQNQILLDQ